MRIMEVNPQLLIVSFFGTFLCIYFFLYWKFYAKKKYFVSFTYKTNYGYEFGNCLIKTDINVHCENGLTKIEHYVLNKVRKTADVRVVILLSIERM